MAVAKAAEINAAIMIVVVSTLRRHCTPCILPNYVYLNPGGKGRAVRLA